jgi:predicted transcriptional regulator
MTKFKAGPWSQQDKKYIVDNAGQLPHEEIAKNLGRNANAVKKYMNDNGLMKYYHSRASGSDGGLTKLSKSIYYSDLCRQFDEKEMNTFEYHWLNTSKQFNDDIMHTEEMQIIDMIKFEILMNRLLNQQADMNQSISELNSSLQKERMKKEPDIELIKHYSIQVESVYIAIGRVQKEYNELHKAKNQIYTSLKATRDQRLKSIESSKETFIDWVKDLIKDSSLRRQLGLEMEKHRVATEVEYKRLSDFHQYSDGCVDLPVLNSSTVK